MRPRTPFTLPKFSHTLTDKYRSVDFRTLRKSPRVKLGAAALAALAAAGIATSVTTSATPTAAADNLKGASQAVSAHHQAGKAHPAPAASHSQAASHSKAPAKPAPHKAPAKPAPHKAPAKPTAHKAPAHKAPAHKAPAHKAPVHHHKAPARHNYSIYDSVTPGSLPQHHEIAIYSNGNYAAPRSAASGRPMLYIDTNGSNPNASVLDVEPGDATPTQAAAWARARLSTNPHNVARIYTMLSEWGATKAAIGQLPASMRSRVRWWIADPTGTPHLVPGSDATQWYWGSGYDISMATPRFG